MKYTFREKFTVNGRFAFIEIPFNVWKVCKKQGMLKVNVDIEHEPTFATQLIPKGQGIYFIPIPGNIATKYYPKEVLTSFEIQENIGVVGANVVAPEPVIELIKEEAPGFSGVACIAMLADISFDEAMRVMKVGKNQTTMGSIMEVLDHFDIRHSGKIIYTITSLPNLCVICTKPGKYSHFIIHYNGQYYDPTEGMLDVVDRDTFVGFLQVFK